MNQNNKYEPDWMTVRLNHKMWQNVNYTEMYGFNPGSKPVTESKCFMEELKLSY